MKVYFILSKEHLKHLTLKFFMVSARFSIYFITYFVMEKDKKPEFFSEAKLSFCLLLHLYFISSNITSACL